MASTWATSWGTSWGTSWDRIVATPVVEDFDTHDGWNRPDKTPDEVETDRHRKRRKELRDTISRLMRGEQKEAEPEPIEAATQTTPVEPEQKPLPKVLTDLLRKPGLSPQIAKLVRQHEELGHLIALYEQEQALEEDDMEAMLVLGLM
jgi:hypothetical protein